MNDQCIGTCGDDAAGQLVKRNFRILLVDADPALYSHGDMHGGLHSGYAIADQYRLGHQAGAKTAILHAIRRTAHIEIDFVVPEILTDLRGGCEIVSVRSAKLKR